MVVAEGCGDAISDVLSFDVIVLLNGVGDWGEVDAKDGRFACDCTHVISSGQGFWGSGW